MPQKHRRLRRIIKAGGGGAFHGVQRIPAWLAGRFSKPAYYLVYFNSIRTGSTMTMRTAGLTSEAVRAHLIASNKSFEVQQPERLAA